MYQRKTVDRFDIECLYETGWEVECSEYSLREAKQTRREYAENTGRSTRIVKHRERIAENE